MSANERTPTSLAEMQTVLSLSEGGPACFSFPALSRAEPPAAATASSASCMLPPFMQLLPQSSAATTLEHSARIDGTAASSPLEYMKELVEIADRLGEENALLKFDRDRLERSVTRLERKATALKAEREELSRDGEWMKAERQALKRERDQHHQDREVLARAGEAMVRVLSEVRGNFVAMQRALMEVNERNQRLAGERERALASNRVLTDEVQAHRAHQETMSSMAVDLGVINAHLLDEQARLRLQRDILANLLEERGSEMVEVRKQNRSLKRQVQEAEQVCGDHVKEAVRLRREVAAIARSPLALAIRSRLRSLLG